jgi:glycosyltransferase involved in cell wall biosynthesis
MKILLLSQFFDPEPSFKGMFFARELVRRGHSVQVLTGFPNYPGGRLYPGYKVKLWQRENMDGIPVFRSPLYPSHDKSSLRRILNYASFALTAATIGAIGVAKPDVVYAYHPPATVALPSTVLRHSMQVPIVADIQDLWPDTVLETGMLKNPIAVSMLQKWCRFAFAQMDQIVVLSPGFKRQLIERGIPAERITVIYNWCDEGAMRMRARDESLANELELAGRFNVVFAGTMGFQQGLDTVLAAAQLCEQRELSRVQFVFVGGGVERDALQGKAANLGLTNVKFLPRQSPEAMGPILALADVLLVHLRDLPLFRITIPSKTQAYLAAGRPILMAVRGDSADLIRESKAGLCCEPENPEALMLAITEFLNMSADARTDMGIRGSEFYRQKLSLHAGVDGFECVFAKAVAARAISGENEIYASKGSD